jgi:hypothetical protein
MMRLTAKPEVVAKKKKKKKKKKKNKKRIENTPHGTHAGTTAERRKALEDESSFFGAMDGASKLILDIFSERGKHARSAIGVAELPRGVPVEIEFVFAIKAE